MNEYKKSDSSYAVVSELNQLNQYSILTSFRLKKI